jgi:hypothetical protein
MHRVLLPLGLLVALFAAMDACGPVRLAVAAPTPIQSAAGTAGSTGANTATYPSSPTNGYIETAAIFSRNATGLGPGGVTDSNSVGLTLESSNDITLLVGIYIYAYAATGSPTGAYACAVGGNASSCSQVGLLELSGTSLAKITYSTCGAITSSTATCTISTTNGDIVLCVLNVQTTAGTLSISNAGSTTVAYVSGVNGRAVFATANSTSSVCTNATANNYWAETLLDISAAGGSSGGNGGASPYPYPPLFTPAMIDVRPRIPELWLAA